VSDQIKAIQGH